MDSRTHRTFASPRTPASPENHHREHLSPLYPYLTLNLNPNPNRHHRRVACLMRTLPFQERPMHVGSVSDDMQLPGQCLAAQGQTGSTLWNQP